MSHFFVSNFKYSVFVVLCLLLQITYLFLNDFFIDNCFISYFFIWFHNNVLLIKTFSTVSQSWSFFWLYHAFSSGLHLLLNPDHVRVLRQQVTWISSPLQVTSFSLSCQDIKKQILTFQGDGWKTLELNPDLDSWTCFALNLLKLNHVGTNKCMQKSFASSHFLNEV